MKNNKDRKKLLIGILSLTILVFVLLLGINYIGIKQYNKNQNKLVATIIENVKEQYPDIDEVEIIKILNTKKLKKSKSLQTYGIDIENEEISLQNKKLFTHLTISNSIIFISYLCLLFIFFLLNSKKEKQKIDLLTEYLMRINQEDYHLDMVSNTEDEFSKLKNEIYKTAITLNEQKNISIQDKETLKDSISDISHQLKTPLTSITIMLDSIIDDEQMEEEIKKEFLGDIHRKINHINFLVQSLLKLSKFDANTILFHKEEVLADQIITSAIDNVSLLAEIKNSKINYKANPKIKIKVDEKWQIEAITNILKNSLEHTKENSEINIEIKDNKIYTMLAITDDGIGIDKEDIEHIFERFYRGKNAASDSVGIGLALAKTIIEKDSGSISVESKMNKGTTFTIKYFKV